MNAESDTRAFKLADIEAAMHRAALRARRIAMQTGTPLIIGENDKIIEVAVTDEEIASFKREIAEK